MDGAAFDRWVANLGGRVGRRAVVLGAFSAFLGGRGTVRGQIRLAVLGEPCTATEQCQQGVFGCGKDPAVICADNGYAEDGSLNCCVGGGQSCGAHAHCCGGLVCLGSHNIDGCGAGQCLPRDTVGTVFAGASCTESAQCSQKDDSVVCSEDGVCCMFEGSRCFAGAQCCGALACVKDDPTDPRWYSPGTCSFSG